MRDLPPLDGLVAVVLAGKLGSFTAAADELGVTHGAVSRRIKAVEEWLDGAVFERNGRGVRLTGDGAMLVKRVERLTQAVAATAEDIRARRPQRSVKISVLPSFARLWLGPRLHLLELPAPELTLKINAEHQLATLDGRETDLAVRTGHGDWPGLDAERLFGESLFAVANRAIADAVGSDPVRVLDHRLLHNGDSADWRRWAREANLDYLPRNGERRFVDYDILLLAARAGLGVALARLPFAASAIDELGLVPLPGPIVEVGRGHWVVARIGEDRPFVRLARERIVELSRKQ